MSSKRLPPIVKSSFDSTSDPEDLCFGNGVGATSKQIREIFPFHVSIDADFNIIQLGNKLGAYFKTRNISKNPIYHHIKDFFQIISPTSCSWDWKTLRKDERSSFELELLLPINSIATPRDVTKSNRIFLIGALSISDVQEGNDFSKFTATFLLSPNVRSNEELMSLDFKLSDFPVHSFQRELLSLETQMQSVTNSVYALDEENKHLKAENERLQAELHSQESNDMKHMIANVAHDLKTPLSAFLNGIDVISDVIKQAETHYEDPSHTKDLPFALDTLQFIKGNVINISEINSFMVMTINRCIDYTKASQGVKLVPSPDTMNVEDALRLPLHCMSVLQGKMKIQLTPLSSDICSHIITDKQWFQENVLCLLSNAVKYSLHGVIQVTVSLKPNISSIAPKQSSYIHAQQKNRSRSVSNASVSSVSPSRTSTIIEHHGGDHRHTFNGSSPVVHERYRDSNTSSEINPQDLVNLDMLSDNDDSVHRKTNGSTGGSGAVHRMSGVSVDSLFRTSLDEEGPDIYGIASPDSFKILTHLTASPPTAASISIPSNGHHSSVSTADSPVSVNNYNGLGSPSRFHSHHTHTSSPHGSGELNKSNKFLSKALSMVAEKLQDESHQMQPLLMIEIEDTGIGLSDEMMANLFSPFSQAQRLAGGTGLGLYSLAKRMEALNGYFGVEKRRDNQQGSLFWFAVPYKPDVDASTAAQKEDEAFSMGNVKMGASRSDKVNGQSSSSEHSGSFAINEDEDYEGEKLMPSLSYSDSFYKESPKSKKSSAKHSPTGGKSPSNFGRFNRSNDSTETTNLYPEGVIPQSVHSDSTLNILLVDDSFPILKMTVQILTRAGYNVDTATNGAEAIERIEAHLRTTGHNFDVVLMDLQMPVIDGLEATRRVRQSEAKMILEYQAHIAALATAAATNTGPGQINSPSSSLSFDMPCEPVLPPSHLIMIGVSASDDSETTMAAFESGFDGFMCKPFKLQTFTDIYASVTAAQQQQQQSDTAECSDGPPTPLSK